MTELRDVLSSASCFLARDNKRNIFLVAAAFLCCHLRMKSFNWNEQAGHFFGSWVVKGQTGVDAAFTPAHAMKYILPRCRHCLIQCLLMKCLQRFFTTQSLGRKILNTPWGLELEINIYHSKMCTHKGEEQASEMRREGGEFEEREK